MNIYTLKLEKYPSYEELGSVTGEIEKIKEIFLHLLTGCDESEKARHIESINSEIGYISACFQYINRTTISYTLLKIHQVDSNIPAAYTEGCNYKLVFIFPDDAQKIQEIIDAEIESLDCVDNIRVALKSNQESVSLYEKARDGGCCGSFDKEVDIDGKIYLIGANYGH